MLRIALAVGLLAACGKPSRNCELAVKHVTTIVTTSGPPGSEPGSQEQAVIDQTAKVTLDRCNDEGLSDAQRD